MVYGRIYKARFPNGKMYVGLTTIGLKTRVSKTRTGMKMPPRTPEQCLNYRRLGEQNANFGNPRSAETRQKIGDAQRGDKNHRFGVKWDEEHLVMFSERQLGEKNHFHGQKHTASAKDKMSAKKRKFSKEDVIEILRRSGEGETQKSIAKSYSVSPTTISRAINGKRRCYSNQGAVHNA